MKHNGIFLIDVLMIMPMDNLVGQHIYYLRYY